MASGVVTSRQTPNSALVGFLDVEGQAAIPRGKRNMLRESESCLGGREEVSPCRHVCGKPNFDGTGSKLRVIPVLGQVSTVVVKGVRAHVSFSAAPLHLDVLVAQPFRSCG